VIASWPFCFNAEAGRVRRLQLLHELLGTFAAPGLFILKPNGRRHAGAERRRE
jgi:hypothetical protein